MPTNASKSALRALMAELARANQALERGALDQARESIDAALAIDPQNVRALQLREQVERGPSPAADLAGSPPPAPAGRDRAAAWSAFEKRVRDRRAERCAVTAREALSRGDVAAARAVTDELASLMPEHPALGELRTLVQPGIQAAQPDAPPTMAPPAATAPAVERVQRRREAPVARRQPLQPRQELPDLNAFASERTLERQAAVRPAPVQEPRRRRRHTAVLGAAAAVLLLGVLLPVDWGRRADSPDTAAVPDAVTESAASRESTVTLDPPAQIEGESVTPAEPDIAAQAPASVPPLSGQVEGLNAEASTETGPPSQSGGDDEAVRTSGASEEPERVEPVETTARNVERPRPSAAEPRVTSPAAPPAPAAEKQDREAEAQRAAYAARELARAEAAQRAVLSRPEPVSSDPSPAPPERERIEPAETGTLARLGTTESASLRTPPPAAAPQPSAAPPAYVPSASSRPAETAAMAVEPPRDAAVRDVLQRYVTAYNRLDAVAAREVWPTVDQSALERAFAQLDSQMLRFDRCDLDVDEEGGIATCAGQARWVPRVGTRDPKREARTWRFELARNGDDWIITRAEARR